MAKRIKVWPPGGGEPITVYEIDAGRLVMNGWKLEPATKPKAKSNDRAGKPTKAEEKVDGNTDGQ